MKSTFKSALLGFAGTAILAPSAQAITTVNGDLLLAFYQTNAAGDTVQPNTYVFNLGQASIWRENTQAFVSVSTVNGNIASSNIGNELAAAFGANWASDGTVKWGLVGGLDQTTVGLVGGDTQGTSYVSRAGTSIFEPTSSQATVNGANRPTLRNNIEAFRNGSNGVGTDIGNDSGSMITINTSLATFEDFLPPVQGSTQFGISQNILGTLSGGTNTLDIWRLAGGTSTAELNTSGIDFTSGLSATNVVLGQGQYIGSISLDSSGNLSVVPEPSSLVVLGVFGAFGLTFRKRTPAKLS